METDDEYGEMTQQGDDYVWWLSLPKKMGMPRGRPSKIDERTLEKLEDAFSQGFTNEEACLSAGISYKTLWRYEQENPEFRERKNLLKSNVTIRAKKSLMKHLPDRPELALKILERMQPDEYSDKSKQDQGNVNNTLVILNSMNELRERVAILPANDQKMILEAAVIDEGENEV